MFICTAMRRKEALKDGLLRRVTVTLDRETIAWVKAQTGETAGCGGWNWPHRPCGTMPKPTGAGSPGPELGGHLLTSELPRNPPPPWSTS